MRKVLIFGNSAAGKSTLAQKFKQTEKLAHLDLDTLAWLPSDPPQRAPLQDSSEKIQSFMQQHDSWVIEGCYADLLEIAAANASELIFMDLPTSLCLENARGRPWEPHKYASKEDQDSKLEFLLSWIAQYDQREDEFSRLAHNTFYTNFNGNKKVIQDNE